MKALYVDGLFEYLKDLWNILDYISNVFYITWIVLRFTAFYIVSVRKLFHQITFIGVPIFMFKMITLNLQLECSQGFDPWYPRDQWDKFDPHMLSECAFASGMILRLVKNVECIGSHILITLTSYLRVTKFDFKLN